MPVNTVSRLAGKTRSTELPSVITQLGCEVRSRNRLLFIRHQDVSGELSGANFMVLHTFQFCFIDPDIRELKNEFT